MKEYIKKIVHKQLYKSARSRALFTIWGIAIKEVQVSFKQFYTWRSPFSSFFRVLSIIGSSVFRLILGRTLRYSFAYTGEDRIIESILKIPITENGFYIDVGCNHPKFLSNTYGLYRKGWRGICIDANPFLIKKYKYCRPRDKAVVALVSNETTTKDFYFAENDVLSTAELENLPMIESQGIEYHKEQIVSQTLTQLLENEQCPTTIDLLSIDAEEHDFQVLSSLDFDKYHVKVIVIEDETFNPSSPNDNIIFNFLKERGYNFEGYLLKNLYFKKA